MGYTQANVFVPRIVFITAIASLASAQQPPLFSPSYGEALRGVMELEPAGATALERTIERNPNDLAARLKVMGYYARGDRATRPQDLQRRIRHALWLVEHRPDSEILRSYVAMFTPEQLSGAEYSRAVALWQSATSKDPTNATIQWNAANFFQALDPGLHLRYVEATAAADPNHPHALRPLAHLYADALARGGAPMQHAQAALSRSNNVWVLGNAAYVLQSYYNQSLQAGAPNRRLSKLAEQYFERAKRIAPKLDRNAILPQIDMQAVARAHQNAEQSRREAETRFKAAALKIRRLGPEAYPELPGAIAGVLRSRKCTVPQPWGEKNRSNVIRGEFYAKGQTAWAVLCSVNQSSSLLVFRHSNDSNPEVLETTEDQRHLQGLEGDEIGYSRKITTIGRYNILRHYGAIGGPEPPPIDHQGIDDAFLGKASFTRYYYQGKWLSLPGAD